MFCSLTNVYRIHTEGHSEKKKIVTMMLWYADIVLSQIFQKEMRLP